MPGDKYHCLLSGPDRATMEEALADLKRMEEIIQQHAPDLMATSKAKEWKEVPGAEALRHKIPG